MRTVGVVDWFGGEKKDGTIVNYGFIRADGNDYFVYYKDVKEKSISTLDIVVFDTEIDDLGRLSAKEVVLLENDFAFQEKLKLDIGYTNHMIERIKDDFNYVGIFHKYHSNWKNVEIVKFNFLPKEFWIEYYLKNGYQNYSEQLWYYFITNLENENNYKYLEKYNRDVSVSCISKEANDHIDELLDIFANNSRALELCFDVVIKFPNGIFKERFLEIVLMHGNTRFIELIPRYILIKIAEKKYISGKDLGSLMYLWSLYKELQDNFTVSGYNSNHGHFINDLFFLLKNISHLDFSNALTIYLELFDGSVIKQELEKRKVDIIGLLDECEKNIDKLLRIDFMESLPDAFFYSVVDKYIIANNIIKINEDEKLKGIFVEIILENRKNNVNFNLNVLRDYFGDSIEYFHEYFSTFSLINYYVELRNKNKSEKYNELLIKLYNDFFASFNEDEDSVFNENKSRLIEIIIQYKKISCFIKIYLSLNNMNIGAFLSMPILLQKEYVIYLLEEITKDTREKNLKMFKNLFLKLDENLQIMLVYYMLKNSRYINFISKLMLNKEDFNIKSRMYLLFMIIDNRNSSIEEKRKIFKRFVILLKERLLDEKKSLNIPEFDKLHNMSYLFPQCIHIMDRKHFYCEGKEWLCEEKQIYGYSRYGIRDYGTGTKKVYYCPRKKETGFTKCSYGYDELFPNPCKKTEKWSIFEVFQITGFWNDNVLNAVQTNTKKCIGQICGMYNRVWELKDKLYCRKCKRLMKFDFTYAKKYFAVYSITIANCEEAINDLSHDSNVYLSHCWNCSNNIDSRDVIRHKDGYYVCGECGAHKTGIGDICPKCGNILLTNTCEKCGHTIDAKK